MCCSGGGLKPDCIKGEGRKSRPNVGLLLFDPCKLIRGGVSEISEPVYHFRLDQASDIVLVGGVQWFIGD